MEQTRKEGPQGQAETRLWKDTKESKMQQSYGGNNQKHNQRTSETLTNLPVRRQHSLQNKEERYTKTVTLQQLPTKGENVHCKKYQTLFICNIYLINMGKNSIKVRRLQFS